MSELQRCPDAIGRQYRTFDPVTKQRTRRPSWRQIRDCELGISHSATNRRGSRCRCARWGKPRRGWKRCDPKHATRWDFARLPADDPHYIPPQRRRISPRHARHMLAIVETYVQTLPPGPARADVKNRLRQATLMVAAWIQTERIYSQVRRYRKQVLMGVATGRMLVYKYHRTRRHVGERLEITAWDPDGFLERCRQRMMTWIDGRGDWPPGYSPGPTTDRVAGPATAQVFLDSRIELVRAERG